MHQNFAIQSVINSFLGNPSTSPIFATILIEFLLKRMKELGSELPKRTVLSTSLSYFRFMLIVLFLDMSDRASLYLRLFKLVFGSVSLLAAESEQMLKVCLLKSTIHTRLVTSSLSLAASPAHSGQPRNGVGADCQRPLQLLPASSRSLPVNRRRIT